MNIAPREDRKSAPRPVVGVSWPRSGHHLLVRLLQAYFAGSFHYCDFYPDVTECCRACPCKWGRTFTKNHDFDLMVPKLVGRPYLVQYRSFLPSVISNYELYVFNGNDDNPRMFRCFLEDQLERYRAFVEKWCDASDGVEKCLVKYEDLTSSPMPTLTRIVEFFAPGSVVDRARAEGVLSSAGSEKIERGSRWFVPDAGLHSARSVETFRYYDSAYFERIRSEVREFE